MGTLTNENSIKKDSNGAENMPHTTRYDEMSWCNIKQWMDQFN